jgi:hypothetical protein
LITLLTLSSLANSQTLSIDTNCSVPCNTLRNALFVKSERDYLKNQIGVVRDSVSLLNVITKSQDSLIVNKNQQIDLYKKNESSFQQVIEGKDKQISLYNDVVKEAEKQKNIAYVLVLFVTLMGIFVF